MKRKLPQYVGWEFAAALLCAVLLSGCASSKTDHLPPIVYSSWTDTIETNLRYSQMLHDAKANELVLTLDEAIAQHARFLGDPKTHWSKERERWRLTMLWSIERYYDRTGKAVPSDVAKIFAGIPPPPPRSCDLERAKLKAP